jgi:uncharacterized membrane protein
MKKFKERFDVFSDAVFAIILTIMVLEVPVEVVDGTLDYSQLAQNIGVYVVSFCFVADCWYKHALIFNEVDEVSHRIIIRDFILVLAVSLIPAFTKLMISDITQTTVMMCGVAYLVVTLLEILIARSILPGKYSDPERMKGVYTYIFGRMNLSSIILIIVFIGVAYFSPVAGLVLFIIIPVRSFMSNASKQQNLADISQLDEAGVSSFMKLSEKDRRKFLALLRSYIHEVRRAQNTEDKQQAWRHFVSGVQRSFGISEQQVSEWFRDAAEHRAFPRQTDQDGRGQARSRVPGNRTEADGAIAQDSAHRSDAAGRGMPGTSADRNGRRRVNKSGDRRYAHGRRLGRR